MNLPTPPKLPAAVVAVLGTVAAVLALVEPTLGSPWREIAAAILAILTALGVQQSARAVSAHGEHVAEHVRRDLGATK